MNKALLSVLLICLAGLAIQPARGQNTFVSYMKSSTGGPLCLAVMNGQIGNNSPLITWDCISGDPSQLFYLSGNMAHIGSKTSNFCMASYDNPAHPGSRVGVWQCQPGDPTQMFNVGASADIDGPNHLCVGVTNASNVRGSPIILWNCQNSMAALNAPNQAWQPGSAQGWATVGALASPGTNQLAIARPPTGIIGINGGNVISNDGGTLVGNSGGTLARPPAPGIIAAGGGNIIAAGGGNIATNNGANVISPNGSNVAYKVQSLPAPVQPAVNHGVCRDAWVTNAISLVTRRAPNGSGDTGECVVTRYGGGRWSSYPDLVVKVAQAFAWPTGGNCRDPWITQATIEVRGVLPTGSGDLGQCDARNYNRGQWANYGVLLAAVKAYYGMR